MRIREAFDKGKRMKRVSLRIFDIDVADIYFLERR